MKPLDPADAHSLNAAQGWLDLGNPAEAARELETLREESRAHPAALETTWLVHVARRDWPRALEVADEEARAQPDSAAGLLHRAYALRRVVGGGVQSAWDTLRPAYDRFPKDPVVSFNLACYACQLGQLEEARRWLGRAMAAGGADRIRTMALSDEDLRPLWPELRRATGD